MIATTENTTTSEALPDLLTTEQAAAPVRARAALPTTGDHPRTRPLSSSHPHSMRPRSPPPRTPAPSSLESVTRRPSHTPNHTSNEPEKGNT